MNVAVAYEIIPRDPDAHLFETRCTISEPDPDGQWVSLPAWTPGSYLIRDFARHVIQVTAATGRRAISIRKIDANTWRCAPSDGPLTIVSEVYAWELSVRSAHFDRTHAYFNGTSLLFRVDGKEQLPCAILLQPPPRGIGARWRVATAMARDGSGPNEFGRYEAENYEEAIDHPVEMGDFELGTFSACGIPHELALTGRYRTDLDRLCRDLEQVCQHHLKFFGNPAPFERYVFLVTAVGHGYGGLEHRASSSLLCSRNDLPRPGEPTVSDSYRTFLSLASHEYFHAWNVKRIRPAEFLRSDLSRRAYTRLLWAFEGITSYYDQLSLVRTGLIPPSSYLELLGQTATRLLRTPGRHKQTLEESSFDSWIKFYQPNENTSNTVVNYYTKGALVACALDLTIRRATRHTTSLDDLMRALWNRYGKTGIGVPEDGIERTATEVSGFDLQAFFDHALRSTNDLPLDELLTDVGVRWTIRQSESDRDKGGKPAAAGDTAPQSPRASLGVRLAEEVSEAKLAAVHDGSPAAEAGLAAGDVLVAADGLRVTSQNLESTLRSFQSGETVRVHAFRRDELMTFDVCLGEVPSDTCVLHFIEDADQSVLDRRHAWLTTRTPP